MVHYASRRSHHFSVPVAVVDFLHTISPYLLVGLWIASVVGSGRTAMVSGQVYFLRKISTVPFVCHPCNQTLC